MKKFEELASIVFTQSIEGHMYHISSYSLSYATENNPIVTIKNDNNKRMYLIELDIIDPHSDPSYTIKESTSLGLDKLNPTFIKRERIHLNCLLHKDEKIKNEFIKSAIEGKAYETEKDNFGKELKKLLRKNLKRIPNPT